MPFLPGYAPAGIGYYTVGRSAVGVPGAPPPGTLFTSNYSGAFGYFVFGYSAFGIAGPPPPPLPGPAVTQTIKSYLYWEYQDDDDLQAFVDAYNTLAQEYLDWFNALNLPCYTSAPVTGLLLNLVGAGLYDYPRPVIGVGQERVEGPLDTWTLDSIPVDGRVVMEQVSFVSTTDDLYRRILTWHLQKSTGKIFSTRWLKQRIMQFLTGVDGIPVNTGDTSRVSVSFGVGNQVCITILKYRSTVVESAALDAFTLDSIPLDWVVVDVVDLGPQYEVAQAFQYAVEGGLLELPFQFDWVVNVQT